MLHIPTLMLKEMDLIEKFRDISLVCELVSRSVKLGMLKVTNHVLEEIKDVQKLDLHLMNQGKEAEFNVDDDGLMRFQNRIYVPDIAKFKRLISEEGHKSNLNNHRGDTKMFQDLKRIFWWLSIKKYFDKFVYSCLVC